MISSGSLSAIRKAPRQSALADTGDADERDELRCRSAACPRERAYDEIELAAATDEPRATVLLYVDAEAGARVDRLPDGHGLRLALRGPARAPGRR